MSSVLQLRRGNTSQNNAFTGAIAEISIDTSTNTLRVHDAVTAGGAFIMPTLRVTNSQRLTLTPQSGQFVFVTDYATAGVAPTWMGDGSTAGGIVAAGATVSSATTATNIAGGTAGQLHYQSAPGVTAFAGPGSYGQILLSGGTSAPGYSSTLTITNGVVSVSGTTNATSTTTGALVVAGGIGVAGDIFVGGKIVAQELDIQYTTVTTTLIQTDDIIQTSNTTPTNSTNTGALKIGGGIGVAGGIYAGGIITATNVFVNGYAVSTASALTIQGSGTGLGTAGTLNFATGTIVTVGSNLATVWLNTATLVANAVTSINLASGAVGSMPYQSGSGATTFLGIGTNGYVLTSNGTAPTWSALSGLSAGLATTATNLAGGTAGQIPYQTAAGATSFTGPGSYGQFLMSTGAGAPVYQSTITQVNGNIIIGTGPDVSAVSTTSGLLQILNGGIAVGKSIFVGTTATAVTLRAGTGASSDLTLTGGLITRTGGSVSITGGNASSPSISSGSGLTAGNNGPLDLYSGSSGNINLRTSTYGQTVVVSSSATYSTATGAFQVIGGAGIAGGLFVGGIVTATTFVGNLTGTASTSTNAATAYSTIGTLTAGTGLSGTAFNGSTNQTWTLNTATLIATSVNLASGTAGQLAYQSAANTTGFVNTATTGNFLQANFNGAPTWTGTASIYVNRATVADSVANALTISTGLTGTAGTYNGSSAVTISLNTATLMATSVNLVSGAAGSLPYQSGAGATTFLGIGTNGYVLTSNGSAPVWSAASGITAGYAAQVQTTAQPLSATYYPTFVDTNNASATAETVYTTSSFMVNPGTRQVGIGYISTNSMLTVNGRIESMTDAASEGGQLVLRGKNFYRWSFDNFNDRFRIIREDDVTEANGVEALTITTGTAVLIGASTTAVGEKFGVTGGGYFSGILTATTFVGNLTGTASTASNAAVAYSTIGIHTAGTGLTGSTFNGSANQTWTLNTATLMANAVTAINLAGGTAGQFAYQTGAGATSFMSTGSMYVNRAVTADATQAAVTFNNSNSGDASGITFNGGTARTVSANTLGALSLSSGGTVSGAVTFSGPVTFSGTATYVSSTQTYYTDNIINLHVPPGGVNSNWTLDDGKDVGFRFHYYTNSTDTNAALVLANDTKWLEWYASGAEGTSTFVGSTYGNFKTGGIWATANMGVGYTAAVTGEKLSVNGGAYVNGTLTATTFVGALSQSHTAGTGLTGSAYNGSAAQTWSLNTATLMQVATQVVQSLSTGTGIFGGSYNGSAAQTWSLNTATLMANAVTSINLASGAAGSLPYQSGAGATTFLGIGTNGYVLTSNGSAPTWTALTGLSAGLATTATNLAGGTAGQVPYQTAAGSTSFVGPGTAGQLLVSAGTSAPVYTNTSSIYIQDSNVSTNLRAGTAGQLHYQTGANTSGFISTATTGNFLQANFNGAPTWTGTANIYVNRATLADSSTNLASGAAGSLPYQSGAGTTTFLGIGTNGYVLTSNGSAPVWSAAGSITAGSATTATSAGTAYATIGTLTAGTGLTGTAFNGSANQTWTLNTATLMNIATQVVQSHTAGTGLTGSAYNGSTAQTWTLNTATLMANAVTSINLASGAAGSMPYQSGSGATTFLGIGTNGYVLTSNGSAPVWSAASGITAGYAAQVQTTAQTASATYYPVFVSANNATATAMTEYTTSTFTINPAGGVVGVAANSGGYALTVSNAGAGSADRLFINCTGAVNSFNIYENSQVAYLNSYNSMSVRVNQLGGSNGNFIVTGGNIYHGQTSVTNTGVSGSNSVYTPALVLGGSTTDSLYQRRWAYGQYQFQTTYAGTNGGYLGLQPYGGNVMIGGSGNTSTNILEVRGTSGQLFSVSDSFTGTIFAASDVSGIPSIEVLDTGLVKFAQYNGQVAISTSTAQTNQGLTVNSSTYLMSLGVGTVASGTTGEIRATNEITAYYSDRRLKENVEVIDNAVTKVLSLNGITYTPNDLAASFGYNKTVKLVGLFADEVESVLPEATRPAPFDIDENGNSKSGENYKTIQYEKLVPLLIEAIKEQQNSINELRNELENLKNTK